MGTDECKTIGKETIIPPDENIIYLYNFIFVHWTSDAGNRNMQMNTIGDTDIAQAKYRFHTSQQEICAVFVGIFGSYYPMAFCYPKCKLNTAL